MMAAVRWDHGMDAEPITQVLRAAAGGDEGAAERLLPLVYDDLRRLARAHLAREAPGRTLQPTALVHEAWLRLCAGGDPGFESRRHFVGAAARAMRRILVDSARRRARKTPGQSAGDPGVDELAAAGTDTDAILDVDALLSEFEREDPRKAEIVHLKFFAGLAHAEIAEMLEISVPTVEREWRFAKALLGSRLDDG